MLRGTLDLIFPPQSLDGGAAMAGGLSPEGWSRIHFLDGPVCDGCGQPVFLISAVARGVRRRSDLTLCRLCNSGAMPNGR